MTSHKKRTSVVRDEDSEKGDSESAESEKDVPKEDSTENSESEEKEPVRLKINDDEYTSAEEDGSHNNKSKEFQPRRKRQKSSPQLTQRQAPGRYQSISRRSSSPVHLRSPSRELVPRSLHKEMEDLTWQKIDCEERPPKESTHFTPRSSGLFSPSKPIVPSPRPSILTASPSVPSLTRALSSADHERPPIIEPHLVVFFSNRFVPYVLVAFSTVSCFKTHFSVKITEATVTWVHEFIGPIPVEIPNDIFPHDFQHELSNIFTRGYTVTTQRTINFSEKVNVSAITELSSENGWRYFIIGVARNNEEARF